MYCAIFFKMVFFSEQFLFHIYLSVQINKTFFEISLLFHHKADIITLYRTMIIIWENHKF